MDAKFVAMRIAQLRIKKGISAKRMSHFLGRNDTYINNIESGKSLPSLNNLFKICDFLNVTPLQFFDSEAQDPEKMNELIKTIKALNDHQLNLILELMKEISRE